MEDLGNAPENSVVVLQACAHTGNPTGKYSLRIVRNGGLGQCKGEYFGELVRITICKCLKYKGFRNV
jgi:hypothetical protein